MSEAADMPLLEMLQVLSRTPTSEPQLRAVVAVTCARWCVARGEDGEAQRLLAWGADGIITDNLRQFATRFPDLL